MNTAYCNDCREFVTTTIWPYWDEVLQKAVSRNICVECGTGSITQADEAIDAAEHRMGRRGEEACE